jgi:hypothetical protein
VTLDERIQALTESVELLASRHRETDERLTAAVTDIKDVMNRMGRILEHHDLTIDDDDDRIDRLDSSWRRCPHSAR